MSKLNLFSCSPNLNVPKLIVIAFLDILAFCLTAYIDSPVPLIHFGSNALISYDVLEKKT